MDEWVMWGVSTNIVFGVMIGLEIGGGGCGV